MSEQSQKGLGESSIGSKLNQILSILMEKNRVSLTMIHRNTGIAIPTIKRLQSDPTANPTIATLLPIASFFGITINQLIGEAPIPENISGYVEKKIEWLKVPIIQWQQVLDWPNVEILNTSDSFTFTDVEIGQNPYALVVEEEDWVGFLKNSILIIDPVLKPEHKDYAIVYKIGQSSPTLKQVMIDEDKIYLKPLNTYFSPTPFDENHRFLGVLVQITNAIKK